MADLTKLSVAELRDLARGDDTFDAIDELASRAGANELVYTQALRERNEARSELAVVREALAAAPRADAPPSDAERERAIEKAIDEFAEWVGEVASAPASGCSSQEIRQLRGHRDEARAALLALLRSAPAPAVQGDERLRELQLRVRGTPMFPRDINPESLAVPVDWLNFAIDALLAQPPAAPAPRCLSCGGTGRMHYVAMEQLRAEHPPAPSPEADHCFSKALGTRTWHCTRCGVFHEKASSVPCKPSPEAAAGAVLAKVREMAARWAAIESDEDLLGGHSGDTETYGRQCAEKWCGKALLELLATPPPASPPAVGARELDPFQAPLPDDARTWSKPPAAGADQGGAS